MLSARCEIAGENGETAFAIEDTKVTKGGKSNSPNFVSLVGGSVVIFCVRLLSNPLLPFMIP